MPKEAATEGAPALHDLTGFQRDALCVIARLNSSDHLSPPKGLDVKEVLDELYGEEVHHGRLYPNLDALVSKGLVQKDGVDGRTNSYRLTERGGRELGVHVGWVASCIGA